jgi:hypothetical protein
VVPAAAGEPAACRRGLGIVADFGQHCGERLHAGQVHVHLDSAGFSQVCVRVIETGKHGYAFSCPVQVAHLRSRSREALDVLVAAHVQHLAPTNCHRLNGLRFVLSEALAGVDDAVIEDDVRGLIRRRGGLRRMRLLYRVALCLSAA